MRLDLTYCTVYVYSEAISIDKIFWNEKTLTSIECWDIRAAHLKLLAKKKLDEKKRFVMNWDWKFKYGKGREKNYKWFLGSCRLGVKICCINAVGHWKIVLLYWCWMRCKLKRQNDIIMLVWYFLWFHLNYLRPIN